MRNFTLVAAVILLLSIPIDESMAQGIDALKAGVVRITSKDRTGTGFIVALLADGAYIVTASHVVAADDRPQVHFFPEPGRARDGRVVQTEPGGPDSDARRGLALIHVDSPLPRGIVRLGLDSSISVNDGESMTVIGFPRIASTPWAVTPATMAGRRGTVLSFSGPVGEGSSGSPLIKTSSDSSGNVRYGWVTGMVTDENGGFGYALPIRTVIFALEGWGVKLFDESRPIPSEPMRPIPRGDLAETLIAFELEQSELIQDVWLMSADGRDPRRLIGLAFEPQWSPDGRNLLFLRRESGITDVWVDRSGPIVRLTGGLGDIQSAAWSPDGRRIAFVSAPAPDQPFASDVFIMNDDGSELRRVTRNPSPKTNVFWSPGGTRLAYSEGVGTEGRTFIMDPDGGNLQELTTPLTNFHGAEWSPDGRRIVGVSFRDNFVVIVTVNADGSEPRQLTHSSMADDGNPAWSPDGSRIVFASTRDGIREIYVMNADGSDQRRLTFGNGAGPVMGVSHPAWQPFAPAELPLR